jgi:hypothetical protein
VPQSSYLKAIFPAETLTDIAQGGLSAILGSTTDPSQIQELTLRAQVFYLSRKKSIPIDFDAYKTYLSSKSLQNPPFISNSTSISSEAPLPPPHQVQPSEPPSSTTQANESSTAPSEKPLQAPYPPTFAEIVQLITTGAPIPGIKDIPPTLLTDKATKPMASKRRKPWETDVPEEVIEGKEGGKVEGTFGDRRDDVIVQELPE